MAKNIKQILVQGAAYPAAIEAAIPVALPALSKTLLDAAATFPDFPDFPVELPDLLPPPTLPVIGTGQLGTRIARGNIIPVIPGDAPRLLTAPMGREILS